MIEKRDCWVCEVCKFAWLIADRDRPPEWCASAKCRSRKWNKSTKLAVSIAEEEKPAAKPEPKKVEVKAKPKPVASEDDDDFFDDLIPNRKVAPVVEPEPDLPMCDYTEYDPDTGETYACGLRMPHPKVKHTRGLAI